MPSFLFFLLVASSLQAAPLDYERDIMPIFEAKCFDCHSAAKKVKGGFRLDDPKWFGVNSKVPPKFCV